MAEDEFSKTKDSIGELGAGNTKRVSWASWRLRELASSEAKSLSNHMRIKTE